MKIKVQRDVFAKKLNGVKEIAGSYIPILNEVLFQVSEKNLKIIGSNVESEISVTVPCKVEGEVFDFVVDPALVYSPASTLKGEDLFIEIEEKDVVISTDGTKNKFSIPINHEADKFPRIQSNEMNHSFTCHGLTLSSTFKKQASFINKNYLIGGFTGVTMIVSEGQMNMYSGLEKMISKSTMRLEEAKGNFNIIIPKNLDQIISIFEASPVTELYVDKDLKNVMITDNSSTIISRLIDEQVVPFGSIFLKSNREIFTTFSKSDITSSLNRMLIFSNELNIVIMDLSKQDHIVLESDDNSRRKSAKEILDFEDKHELMNFVVGHHLKQLLTIFRNIESETIVMSQESYNQTAFFFDDHNPEVSFQWAVAPMVIDASRNAVRD